MGLHYKSVCSSDSELVWLNSHLKNSLKFANVGFLSQSVVSWDGESISGPHI